MHFRPIFYFALVTCSMLIGTAARPQSLDMQFGNGGILAMPMATGHERMRKMVIRDDGTIYLAGDYRGYYPTPSDTEWWLARLLPQGQLDPSFAGQGYYVWDICTGDESVVGLDVADDGSVFISGHEGYFYFNLYDVGLVGKLTPAGAPDPGFGAYPGQPGVSMIRFGTTIKTNALATALLPDGSVNGLFKEYNPGRRLYFAHLDAGGILDTSFHAPVSGTYVHGSDMYQSAAIATPDGGFLSMAVEAVIGATPTVKLAKITPGGSIDTTYADHGILTYNYVTYGIAISNGPLYLDAQGRSLILSGVELVRVTPNGEIDGTFGVNGKVPAVPYIRAMVPDAQGGIIAFRKDTIGEYLCRFDEQGQIDPSFGTNGRFTLPVEVGTSNLVMEFGPDGRLFIAHNCACPQWMPPTGVNGSLVLMYALHMDLQTGIPEEAATDLILSPNPASEQVLIKTPGASSGFIEVWDMRGAVLLSRRSASADMQVLDVSNLTPGIYGVRFTTETGTYRVGRLMVVR